MGTGMGEAAKRQPQQPWADGSSDLLRRLLARRSAAATPVARAPEAPVLEGETPSAQDAAILVLKAALRAQRAEVGSLQAQLAELRSARG